MTDSTPQFEKKDILYMYMNKYFISKRVPFLVLRQSSKSEYTTLQKHSEPYLITRSETKRVERECH